MIAKEKTMSSETIYHGKILKLRVDTVELPEKKYSKREIIEHSGGVGIIAIDKDSKIVLVKQFRKAAEEVLLEIPAGKLENLEETLECAKRELKEETGFIAKNIDFLFKFYASPGYTNEIIHIFLAKNLIKSTQELDEGEFIDVVKVTLQEAIELIYQGKIKDGKSIAAIFALKSSKM